MPEMEVGHENLSPQETGVPEPDNTIGPADVAADLHRQLEEANRKLEIAEKNKTKANNEAAKYRTELNKQKKVNQEVTETIAQAVGADSPTEIVQQMEQIRSENHKWRTEDLARQAAEAAGVPADLAINYLRGAGKLDSIDVSDTTNARSQIDAAITQVTEQFPTVVQKQEAATQDPWATPDPAAKGASPVDVVAYLERVALEDPDRLMEEWERLGGDEHSKLMTQGVQI